MAMRVITLDRLKDYIEDKVVSEQNLIRGTDFVEYRDKVTGDITCHIPNSRVSNLDDEHPFLKFRDQVNGVLEVCGDGVNIEDIISYSYLLDL